MAVHAPEAPAGSVARNVRDVSERILRACDRARRDPRDITLVGVTKTVPAERVREALDAGICHLGENRVQDALEKMITLADRAPTWHFIGHLQTNKARLVAETFDCIESVDSLKLAKVLEEDALEIGRELNVYVQLNLDGEASKGGVGASEVASLIEEIDAMPSILVTGLMSIPPARNLADDSRRDFRALKAIFEKLRANRPEICNLSMGMSSDFEIAIEEGATEVRVGTALFGRR